MKLTEASSCAALPGIDELNELRFISDGTQRPEEPSSPRGQDCLRAN